MRPPHDVAIIGGGILGLATARSLLQQRPAVRVVVLEKEREIALHQSGRNSGVIHRGIYYAPGSLKARLCSTGSRRLTAYCDEKGIPWERTGKVIIAVTNREVPRLLELYQRGVDNEVPGLELIGPERLRELEPSATGVRAVYSPQTGIVDFRRVALALADDVRNLGGQVRLRSGVRAIHETSEGVHLETESGEVRARYLIACAGLQSDRVAGMTDPDALREMRIIPFRGDYYVLRPERSFLCRSLIYPVPDPRFPFLGVHFTKRVDGSVWAGPNAVLALARERYGRADVRVADVLDTLTFRGFWHLAASYWRMGMGEAWRDVARHAFANALRRYVPDLRDDDLVPGPAGNRAQAVGRDGSLIDDFSFASSGRSIHVRNAPSPGATSSLEISEMIATQARSHFALGR